MTDAHQFTLRALFAFVLPLTGLATMTAADATSRGGFLFVTFNGEKTPMGEQIYFGLSQDGRRWGVLNDHKPVLVSALGEKGVRDPFIMRSHDGKTCYLLATDLSIHFNGNWNRATHHGSQSIVIWETTDLVHWSEPRLVQVAAEDAGCTWAPEAVYDEDAKDYLVFYASQNKSDNFAKQRIWANHTSDFKTFSKPAIYIEKSGHVIDTTIIRDQGTYYRFSKNETVKTIIMETSTHLLGPWQEKADFSLAKMAGYEGPTCFLLEAAGSGKSPTWCLLLDYYSKGAGYQPFLSHDLNGGQFTPDKTFSFPFRFRHGTVMPITAAEYERLTATYGKPEFAQ